MALDPRLEYLIDDLRCDLVLVRHLAGERIRTDTRTRSPGLNVLGDHRYAHILIRTWYAWLRQGRTILLRKRRKMSIGY